MGLFSRRKLSDPAKPVKASERIAITGIGTVTPQAQNTLATALALRFGKTSWCSHETVLVAGDRHGITLRGATVSRIDADLIAPELDGAQRAAALFQPALQECLAGLSTRELYGLKCRIDNCIELGRGDFAPLVGKSFPLLNFEAAQANQGAIPQLGRCSFFELIMKGCEVLATGMESRLVVGCVDSLCAASFLMVVRDAEVLKDAMVPDGIIAGEAAGAVLLERESFARRRKASVLAFVNSWGRGAENGSWYEPPLAIGCGLGSALNEALSGVNDRGEVTVVADLNGERHRALDWAYAQGRVWKGGKEPELRHPAFLTGDCGGATGAVLLADGIGRYLFHPQFRRPIVLTTSDPCGARRAICLAAGDKPERKELMQRIRGSRGNHREDERRKRTCPQR